jgi:dipeptidyl-peptidase-4
MTLRCARKATLLILLLSALALQAQERFKEFTVDDIWTSGKFTGRGIRGFQWIEGGKAYSYLETDTARKQTDLWRCDVASGKKRVLVSGSKLVLKEGDAAFTVQNYIWSPSGKQVLFTGTLAARSLKTGGNFFLYDLPGASFRQLTHSTEEQVNVKFSPDGSSIGFVRANNIFVLDLASGNETQLTFDGSEHVFNGKFDWVYEEEFSIIDGWQWSPDSRRIAYWQLNELRVPEFPIMTFLPLHQDVSRMRYPKAGDPNSIVRVGIVSLGEKNTVWADIGAPADSSQDTYVPYMKWTNDPDVLSVVRLNRKQNHIDLTLVNAASGAAKIILTESSDTYIDADWPVLTFLKKSRQFLWSSERDGFDHLYLYDLDGKLVRQITQGRWDVESVNGVDERKQTVYFTAGIINPMEREVYAVGLDGKDFRKVTKERGSSGANFSPDFSVFVHSFSDVNTPPKSFLRKADGSLIRVLTEGTIDALKDYKLSPKTFFTFTTSDSVELNGWMIKPAGFDPAKKYPVLMFVYGGPGSQTVRNAWGGSDFLWYQLLAAKGYIIVSVDNRGTGARGKQFKAITYRNLGKWETHDQMEAARYLGSLPYVEKSRIGIWGWSYGGYMALMSILVGADVFKTAISVAPVTNWKFYDTIYTERYMSTPEDNPDGYRESAPVNHARELKGKLLIVHGTSDDNVHWQNTVCMVDTLTKAGKQFETAFYPGGKHGIGTGKTRAQLYTRFTNFLLENL